MRLIQIFLCFAISASAQLSRFGFEVGTRYNYFYPFASNIFIVPGTLKVFGQFGRVEANVGIMLHPLYKSVVLGINFGETYSLKRDKSKLMPYIENNNELYGFSQGLIRSFPITQQKLGISDKRVLTRHYVINASILFGIELKIMKFWSFYTALGGGVSYILMQDLTAPEDNIYYFQGKDDKGFRGILTGKFGFRFFITQKKQYNFSGVK
jgi:hypothetical protein